MDELGVRPALTGRPRARDLLVDTCPEAHGGEPGLVGMRITVFDVLAHLADGVASAQGRSRRVPLGDAGPHAQSGDGVELDGTVRVN